MTDLHKQAGNPIVDAALKLVGKSGELTVGGLSMALAGLGAAGLGGGYLLAKATSPKSIVDNTDRELVREALATEIDVTQRRLAALELRKQRMAQQKKESRPYDRFV